LKRDINHRLSQLPVSVEHPLRAIRCQFGFTSVRYREVAKDTAQPTTRFALSNLYLVKRQLLRGAG
jgi:transposase, IS5 family